MSTFPALVWLSVFTRKKNPNNTETLVLGTGELSAFFFFCVSKICAKKKLWFKVQSPLYFYHMLCGFKLYFGATTLYTLFLLLFLDDVSVSFSFGNELFYL